MPSLLSPKKTWFCTQRFPQGTMKTYISQAKPVPTKNKKLIAYTEVHLTLFAYPVYSHPDKLIRMDNREEEEATSTVFTIYCWCLNCGTF